MVKALLFDMDGLMIDSERLYFQTEREIAHKFNKNVGDKTLWKMMGRTPLESLDIFVRETGIPLSAEEALEMRNQIMRQRLKKDLKPMPGLFSILNTFYGKLKMTVCTSAQKEFLEMVVNQLGIGEKFNVLQASDNLRKGKPNPEIYLKCCRRLKLPPQECLVLEDSSNGALAGKRAGCYVIAIPTQYTSGQDFHFVDFKAKDLFQAEKHIREMLNTC